MLLPRRKFLESSLLFGASAFLVFGSPRLGFSQDFFNPSQLSQEVLKDPVYRFTRQTFEPYIGGYFEAPNARGEMVALKLLKVEAYEPASKSMMLTRAVVETDSFSLLFSAAGPLPPFTSIHTIKHGALGEFSLFLSRKNGKNREIYYEAVINHVR